MGPLLLFCMLASALLALFFYLYLHYDRTTKLMMNERGRNKPFMYEDNEPLLNRDIKVEQHSNKYLTSNRDLYTDDNARFSHTSYETIG